MPEYTLKTKNINNKTLLKEISTFIGGIVENFNIKWIDEKQRDAILEVVDEFLEDLHLGPNKIEQWNVICDSRNNKLIKTKSICLDVYYRQRHCYNVSVLHYVIKL